jgi:hypothetical protein
MMILRENSKPPIKFTRQDQFKTLAKNLASHFLKKFNFTRKICRHVNYILD